jgi:hypothetical protein
VNLRQGDAEYLQGLKCHRCRKCRAPSCPAQPSPGTAPRARRRGAVDPGEVIDAETMNRAGHFEPTNLQSLWFSSPEKEFTAFGNSRAFPEFVAATNQAEEALTAEHNNFVHVLSRDFDMSDLVLPGNPQIQLNPLSLDDQQVNAWATGGPGQLDLPEFSGSQADIASQSAAKLSFTELLASEDDIFEPVSSNGLGLTAEWTGGIYGSGSVIPSESFATDVSGAANVASIPLVAPLNQRETDVINSGFDNFALLKARLFGTATLYPQVNDLAAGNITTNAGNHNHAALISGNGTACPTPLPVNSCGSNSYNYLIAPSE